jgi:glycosyltransferase involved in cell wall biosynthesis
MPQPDSLPARRLCARTVPVAKPTSRPRIAYLITNSEIGGAQSHVLDLLRGLSARMDAVVMAGSDGPLFDAATALGARTIRLSRLDNSLSPMRAVLAVRELMQALRQAAPDLIHVHSAKAAALGRIAGRLLNIPVVYTVHGFAFKPAAPAKQRMAALLAEWLLAPLTTRMICVAGAEQSMAARLPVPPAHVSVIRNGIADNALRADPVATCRRIVMVSRFAAPKRPDLLIRAFAQAKLGACELTIAGDGPQRDACRALAAGFPDARISLPGNVTDIAGLLATAQGFVLVSDHEGFPISILEAMRAGLPVIASDLPGIREQLDDGRCGTLVPGNDADALAAALSALAEDAGLRARLGQAAREHWQAEFGLQNMVDQTWHIYQQAANGTIPALHPAKATP